MNKALFLDRDGVINKDVRHLHTIEECVFCDGIFELAREYQNNGYLIIIVTNQAGIAKGIYTEEQYYVLREWIHEQFKDHGVIITAEYFCPHHPDYTESCKCRKPEPGMLLLAAKEHDIDLSQSVIIGDKDSDIEAGQRAGVGRRLLLSS